MGSGAVDRSQYCPRHRPAAKNQIAPLRRDRRVIFIVTSYNTIGYDKLCDIRPCMGCWRY
jgi:hypothetical protein